MIVFWSFVPFFISVKGNPFVAWALGPDSDVETGKDLFGERHGDHIDVDAAPTDVAPATPFCQDGELLPLLAVAELALVAVPGQASVEQAKPTLIEPLIEYPEDIATEDPRPRPGQRRLQKNVLSSTLFQL